MICQEVWPGWSTLAPLRTGSPGRRPPTTRGIQTVWPRWPLFGRPRALNAAAYCAPVSTVSAGQQRNEQAADAPDTVYGSEGHHRVSAIIAQSVFVTSGAKVGVKWPPRDLFPFKRGCLYCQFSVNSYILSHGGLAGAGSRPRPAWWTVANGPERAQGDLIIRRSVARSLSCPPAPQPIAVARIPSRCAWRVPQGQS